MPLTPSPGEELTAPAADLPKPEPEKQKKRLDELPRPKRGPEEKLTKTDQRTHLLPTLLCRQDRDVFKQYLRDREMARVAHLLALSDDWETQTRKKLEEVHRQAKFEMDHQGSKSAAEEAPLGLQAAAGSDREEMSTAPPVRLAAGKPATSIVNPVKRKANVLEMLSYAATSACCAADACEAYNASLPPGWTEHVDANGRTYFYNTNRRESLWKHPLDQEFVEIANYWRRAIKAGGFWDIDEELAEMEEQIRASLADWMELYDETGHKFFFNRKTEESLFNDPRHITYHSLYTRIRRGAVKFLLWTLPHIDSQDPIVNISELERQQKAAEAKALASVTRMQAAVRVMLARRKARLLQAKRCLNRVPHDMKGKLRLTVRTAVPGTNQTECIGGTAIKDDVEKLRAGQHLVVGTPGRVYDMVNKNNLRVDDLKVFVLDEADELMSRGFKDHSVLRVTSSYRRNRAASKIQARIRGFLARRRYRPMRDHRRYLIQNTIRIQRAIRRWLSTLADVKAARQARVQAVIRMQCWARSIAARKLYAEKLGAKATFVKLKQVVIHIQCHVRQWLAKRRVREIRRVKYTPSVRMIQRQMKVFKAKAELMQHLRNHEPVDLIFHLTSGQKGSKILPFVWKLGMLPVGEDGKVINPEAFRDQKRLEKMRRQAKVYRKQKECQDDFDEEPPKSIDLFSKVGLESLSVAAASVIQQTFHATQSGKKCRRAFALIRDVLDTAGSGMVEKAKELAEKHGWMLCRQFETPANAKIHYDSTGHEILNDFEGTRLDYFVAGYGTGGTYAGVGKLLRERSLGWTPDFLAKVAEDGIKELGYDEYIPIPSGGAIEMSLMLSQTQGIFTGGWAGRVKPGADPRSVDAPGISGGASAWAAIEVAKKAPEGSVILAVIADTAERYLSTPLFSQVSADMDEETAAISKSTPSFQLEPKESRIQHRGQKASAQAADLVAVRAAAAPQIQRVFRGWRVRRSNILEKKRHAYFVKKLEQIETVQSFMHRFACQVSLRDFCRESRVFMAASKIQAHVRGMLTRNYVARLAEEAEWPLKGWFEYTGMGRDCVQLNVKFLLNPSFDAFRHFRKYGKQQTLLQRLQEMQAEIDSCLRMYLGPAEYAAMEARKAAGSAAQRAKAEAEREQEEVNAMAAADQESFAIEKTVRAEEAAVRREEEEKLRAEEEERLRAEEEERLRAEEEERLRAEAEAQRAEEDANISTVSQALANFTYAAQALLGEAFDCEVSVIGFTMVYLIKPSR
eukprot:g17805.t1